ncbi:MAG: efflux RND transporter permease subunit [Crocinitomicaceae bacterium]
MRGLVQFFIKKPIWANAVIIVTVLFGVFSLMNMNRSFFPELDPKTVYVTVSYPGASPEEMEEGVTIKIEQALRGLDGVEMITSTSSENVATIRIKGFENADMDEVYKDVENAVSSINSFPQGAEKPIVKRLKSNPMSEMVATIGLGGNSDLWVLKKEADNIENDLYASGLISIIDLRGFPEMELVVSVRETDLLKYGMLIDEISLAIQRNNQDLTGGILRNAEEELIIRSRERSTDPEIIEEIVVRTTPQGDKITIGDVADVNLAFSENSFEVFSDGNPAISIDVKKTPDQDLGEITDFLKDYITEYNEADKPGELNLEYEFAASLQDRINLLTNNGIVGLLLVLLMLGLFLSTRLSLWVAFGIPFSFLGMFIVAVQLGLTINMISLFGMILVVGILVDDGIVIAENIYSHFEKGKSPFKAALDGTMEVMPSVFTSVLTTIAAFSILLFVEKMEMMREMPIVVIVALAFSLIEAFIILPVHLASEKVLSKAKVGTPRHKVRNRITKAVEYLKDKIFMDVLVFAVKRYRAYVLLPLIFVVFVIGFSTKGLINYTFFPEIKPDRIMLEVAFEQGTGKEITKNWLLQSERFVLAANEELAAATGDTLLSEYSVMLGTASSIGETGFHTGQITMIIDGEGKKTPVDSLMSRIMRKVNTLEETKLATNVYIGGGIHNFGKPIEFSFTGNDDVQIRNAKDRFKEYVAEIPLVSNLKDNEPLGRKEINIKMKPEADFYGLGIFEVTKQIRQGIFGQEAQRVIVGTDEVKIWVRYDQEDREDQADLDNLRIKTTDGKQILLSEIVTKEIARGPVSLKRRDGRREIVVDASVDDPTKVGKVNTEIVESVIPKVLAEFPGVEIIQRGQGERSEKALMSMQINVMILFVVMIIIMSLNFESVWQALLILLVVPAGVAGGILGHSIIGIPVSILSAFGMIALIGILINDSIVFLDTYNRNILEGMSTKDAAIDAARSRFRPILLTSVTTVAGLLPLILETSFQAQFLIPMAVSIAFGLLFGTVFILFFFPAIILVHNDMRRVFHRMLNNDEYEAEQKSTGDLAKFLQIMGYVLYYLIGAAAVLGGLALAGFAIVKAWSSGFIVLGLILAGLGVFIFLLKHKEKVIMMKTQLTIAMFIVPVVLVAKGLGMMDQEVISSLVIGGAMIAAAGLFVAFLPLGLFEKLIRLIWETEQLPDARNVEPILINKKHQEKRDLTES